jgi:hypothetical protein
VITGDRGNPHYAAELDGKGGCCINLEANFVDFHAFTGKSDVKAATTEPKKAAAMDEDDLLASIASQIEPPCPTVGAIAASVEGLLVMEDKEPQHVPAMLVAMKKKEEPIVPKASPSVTSQKTDENKNVEELILPTSAPALTCKKTEKPKEAVAAKEEPIKAKVDQSKTAASKEDKIKAEKAKPTGDKGNVHYSKELNVGG